VKSVRGGENLYTNSVVVLDAKTGNYLNHFPSAPTDWHDWDVSSAPSIFMTHGGKQLLSFAPKNGHLYGFDLATRQLLYRNPVTRIENADVPLSTDKAVHFCPGAVGGSEWNGVAGGPNALLRAGFGLLPMARRQGATPENLVMRAMIYDEISSLIACQIARVVKGFGL
jgi:hypothetical protein